MNTQLHLRPATEADCSDLAVLADMATRRISSFLWSLPAEDGQSAFEIGREAIRSNPDSPLHCSNWQVAVSDGRIAGGMNGYILNDNALPAPPPDALRVLEPLDALKRMAEGSWYISALAVFQCARGQGVGQTLLRKAERMADDAGATQLTLMVGSFNPLARTLYQRMGFQEQARRDFVPFHGSDRSGSWILMAKDLRSGE